MAKKAGIKPLRINFSLPIDIAAGLGITPQVTFTVSSEKVGCKVSARPRMTLFNWNLTK